jgi:hypothetical protein
MKPTNEFGYTSAGIAWLDLRGINNSLAALKLSPFLENAWTLSLGHHTERGRWISEGGATLRIWGDHRDLGYRSSLYIGDFSCRSGINVLPTYLPINLYPYWGLGIGLNTLNIRSDQKALSELLVSSQPHAFLWQVTGLLDLGLGSEFKYSDKNGGCAIGLRMGYLVDLYKNKKWISDGVRVTGLSSISQNGPYIRLVLGGWDKHQHVKHASCSDSL